MNGKGITVSEASADILRPLTEVTAVLNAKGVIIGYFEPACLFETPEASGPLAVDSSNNDETQGSWRDRKPML